MLNASTVACSTWQSLGMEFVFNYIRMQQQPTNEHALIRMLAENTHRNIPYLWTSIYHSHNIQSVPPQVEIRNVFFIRNGDMDRNAAQ